ncbi:cysteinyl leukotriene receptor 2-like [Homarus americanus]|uniref:Neuropeptide SIFamide receptor-like 5 n=1 Tax=Homarus americanus TaxID=6706 RepID=A0A8J5JCX0_HOMAM|nr:cysteinyl leukotriene receptor 2-like [Homarus americanus]KAG7156107.1 Neuropeptide SIFamide receptor-like 5 [Homarus americanus]
MASLTEEGVDRGHQVVYRQILPIVICLGVLSNGLCVFILSRPSLRSARVNRYFLVLAVSDLLVCLFYIPVSTTITGCTFSSYAEAFYFSHFGWTLVGIAQAIGTYTILWLSLDRFIAVWWYSLYPSIQKKPNVLRNRMVVTVFLCIITHLAYMFTSTVYYCSNADETDDLCTEGTLIVKTGYQNHFDETWHKIYRSLFGLFIRWVPCCLLLLFNVGLVIGVMRGRVNFPATGHGTGRSGERTLVITMIAITASYILLTLPITVYIMAYATYVVNRCSEEYPKEVLRAVGNCLQLFEHVIHIVFLVGLNNGFRKELKILLHLEERKKQMDPGGVELGVSHSQFGGLEVSCHKNQQNSVSLTPALSNSNRHTMAEDL